MKKAVQILFLSAFLLTFMLTKTINVMQDTEEIWKPIVGYEGKYEVSNKGRVKSLVRKGVTYERILSLASNQGYPQCAISHGGKNTSKTYRVHKLVALAFIGPANPGQEVNHKNGIRNDNRPENLEWTSHQENILHAFRSGIKSQEGEKCPRAILNEKKVLEIRALKGSMPYSSIAKIYGVHKSTIKNIVSRRQWDHI